MAIKCEDLKWIELAQYVIRCLDFMLTVMNHWPNNNQDSLYRVNNCQLLE